MTATQIILCVIAFLVVVLIVAGLWYFFKVRKTAGDKTVVSAESLSSVIQPENLPSAIPSQPQQVYQPQYQQVPQPQPQTQPQPQAQTQPPQPQPQAQYQQVPQLQPQPQPQAQYQQVPQPPQQPQQNQLQQRRVTENGGSFRTWRKV